MKAVWTVVVCLIILGLSSMGFITLRSQEKKQVSTEINVDSVVAMRDMEITTRVDGNVYTDNIDTLISQSNRELSSISNDSLRKEYDSLFKNKIDGVMAKYGYKIIRNKAIKKDTLNVDGYQIVISHITDGCLCQYVKEVELISPNVDEDEVPTKPAPKKKNKAKPITQEEFLED